MKRMTTFRLEIGTYVQAYGTLRHFLCGLQCTFLNDLYRSSSRERRAYERADRTRTTPDETHGECFRTTLSAHSDERDLHMYTGGLRTCPASANGEQSVYLFKRELFDVRASFDRVRRKRSDQNHGHHWL